MDLVTRPSLYQVENLHYMLSSGPDMINAHLRSGKAWEPTTLQIAQLLIEGIERPVLVDVGANLGAWSVPMGDHIRTKGGILYAFEPQRQVYYQLCANLFSNQLFHCHAMQMAIGDVNGEIDVPVLDMQNEVNVGALSLDADIRAQQKMLSTDITTCESVRIATIDSLKLPAAHLVKIDVEGLELEVLKGARLWLGSSGYPAILFEVWGDYLPGLIPKRNRLLNLLKRALGYEVDMFGELGIAQHPQNKRLEIKRTDKGMEIRRLF
ncbi:FkbM family methyltransferase [Pantoea trifolii]|uniref:FkbM family methyltransferase n=1 Tax=Pantoea trifolii TaxID=2968030 RepID=A0ABT1VII6_9GAMM|nr:MULTISPECIES: FkbM family methyltransferase [unclassified Pantoea]MCQ8226697.1 FkbM family methyltransferase [Pantoea sp. MMK2]MCQ8234869.1 FkbM family methyltransferase [Pantoea sp. MMK3]